MTIDGLTLDELLEAKTERTNDPTPNLVEESARFLRAKAVAARYEVCVKTVDRWEADPRLGFPQAIWINKIRFWNLAELVAWERARARAA